LILSQLKGGRISTEERLFDVIFEGKTLNGVSLEQAINALSKLSRREPDDIASLCNECPTPVKKRVSKEIALQYRQALINAGLACRINKTEPLVETVETEKSLDHDVNFSKREKVSSQEEIETKISVADISKKGREKIAKSFEDTCPGKYGVRFVRYEENGFSKSYVVFSGSKENITKMKKSRAKKILLSLS